MSNPPAKVRKTSLAFCPFCQRKIENFRLSERAHFGFYIDPTLWTIFLMFFARWGNLCPALKFCLLDWALFLSRKCRRKDVGLIAASAPAVHPAHLT